ncbi:ATP-dependent DNA ligase [compost metagenome]
MQQDNISLYYKDGRSNKEYHAQLQQKDAGWVVLFQYGPRGGTLTTGTKTKEPVDYEVAKKAYDKLVKEKVGKGYQPGEEGSAYVGTSLEERFTGIVPQLLNPIDEAGAQALITDPDWVMQEKHDGHRRLVQMTSEQLLGINRKGLVTGLPEAVALELKSLETHAPFVLDGELVGEELFLFDILEWEGQDLRGAEYGYRLAMLSMVGDYLKKADAEAVTVSPTEGSEEGKRKLYEAIRAAGREGLVFKRVTSQYVPGRPNSGGNQLKRKFVHSASVLVAARNPTKRSVSIQVLDADFKKVDVGNVTIPANYDIPAVGAIVELEYLYAYEGGSLYQPQYKGVRDDLDGTACTISQLHYKPAGASGAGESEDE